MLKSVLPTIPTGGNDYSCPHIFYSRYSDRINTKNYREKMNSPQKRSDEIQKHKNPRNSQRDSEDENAKINYGEKTVIDSVSRYQSFLLLLQRHYLCN